MKLPPLRSTTALLAAALCACPVKPTRPEPDAGGSTAEGECLTAPTFAEDVSACQPLATDYRPRVDSSAGDSWPACISDDNAYHRIQPTVSSVARVTAFDDIAAKLWEGGKAASPQDFIDARVSYAVDQGLDSRVQRREDVHYPAPAAGAKCRDGAAVVTANPDRCLGPGKLLPILNDAFARGAGGESPRLQARRIEAALLWFLYASALSEGTTCATAPADCDSCWAYYTGGTDRGAPLGLARYVNALGLETHRRAYDATLAVRCWRNLDNEAGTATNLALRDQALAQLDVALLRGVALIVRQRFTELGCTTGEAREGRYAGLQVLVPLLDRASRAKDPARADVLMAQVAGADSSGVDIGAATGALDALYGCP